MVLWLSEMKALVWVTLYRSRTILRDKGPSQAITPTGTLSSSRWTTSEISRTCTKIWTTRWNQSSKTLERITGWVRSRIRRSRLTWWTRISMKEGLNHRQQLSHNSHLQELIVFSSARSPSSSNSVRIHPWTSFLPQLKFQANMRIPLIFQNSQPRKVHLPASKCQF